MIKRVTISLLLSLSTIAIAENIEYVCVVNDTNSSFNYSIDNTLVSNEVPALSSSCIEFNQYTSPEYLLHIKGHVNQDIKIDKRILKRSDKHPYDKPVIVSKEPYKLSYVSGNHSISYNISESIESKLSLKKWMGKIQDNKQLNEIVIPGSHDAGMEKDSLTSCSLSVKQSWVRTQFKTITQQLESGVRYFDVRVRLNEKKNSLTTYHGNPGFDCDREKIKDILTNVENFLKSNPSETVILHFNNIRENAKKSAATTLEELIQLINSNNEYLFKSTDLTLNLNTIRLKPLRGKILVIIEDDKFKESPDKGIFAFNNYDPSKVSNSGITIVGGYSNKPEYKDIAKFQFENWQKYAQLGDNNKLFLLAWQATGTAGALDIENLTVPVQGHLGQQLYDNIIKNSMNIPNIIQTDYVNNSVSREIISYNLDLNNQRLI